MAFAIDFFNTEIGNSNYTSGLPYEIETREILETIARNPREYLRRSETIFVTDFRRHLGLAATRMYMYDFIML